MNPKKPAQPNKSLIDGLECLEAVALAGQPIGVRELARLLGLEPTRVSRLLGTLAYLGLTEKTDTRKYAPGPGIHVLSAMGLSGSHLLRASLPVIRRLMQERGMRVAVGVLWRRHVCYFYHGTPDQPFEQAIGGHRLYPAERSSIGRILLAEKRKKDVEDLFADDPDVDTGQLLQDLVQVKKDGYCRAPDGNSLAVGIGEIPFAGLAFSSVDPDNIPRLVQELHEAAAEIAQSLKH